MEHQISDTKIRRFLLRDTLPDDELLIEQLLLSDDDFDIRVQLCEDVLIDDFVSGALPEPDRRLFEQNFLYSPERREKLLFAQASVRYAEIYKSSMAGKKGDLDVALDLAAAHNSAAAVGPLKNNSVTQPEGSPSEERRGREWWIPQFAPAWIFCFLLVVVSISLFVWWFFLRGQNYDQFTQALNRAFSYERPIEARISGFDYAEFPTPVTLMGSGQSEKSKKTKIDPVAFEQAKQFLFGRKHENSDPEFQHALGKYYLTQKDFTNSLLFLRKGVEQSPHNAFLLADLGAALLGKIESERTALGADAADVNQCLSALDRALALKPNLTEALFNRALLKQREKLWREAQADWNKYLEIDPSSKWAEEARIHLEQVKEALSKVTLVGNQFDNEFISIISSHEDQKVLNAYSSSFSFQGNRFVENLLEAFLAARSSGDETKAQEMLKDMAYLGGLAKLKYQDFFVAELADFYQRAGPEQFTKSVRAHKLMDTAYENYKKAENDQALEKYQQAWSLFNEVGNQGEALFAKALIGHTHHQRSEAIQNLRSFTDLLKVLPQKRYRWMESNAWCGLANGHISAGQFSEAIKDCRQCGKLAGELNDRKSQLRSMYMLGEFYYHLGKHRDSLRICAEGMSLAQEIPTEIPYVIPFYNITAWNFSALGLPVAATTFESEAIGMAEFSGMPRLVSYAHFYNGLIYARQNMFEKAVLEIDKGIEVTQKIKDEGTKQDIVHRGKLHLGHIYRSAGRYTEAINAFDQVMDFFQHSRKQAYFYGAAKGRLLTLIAQGNNQAADKEVGKVIDLYEKYRRNIQEESIRSTFFDQEQNIYDVATDFAYSRLKDCERALDYAESGRARSLRDMMIQGGVVITDQGAPDLSLKSGVLPRRAGEIKRLVPPDVQLLEYAVLTDKTLAWIINRGVIKCIQINVTAVELNQLLDQYLENIKLNPGITDQSWRQLAAELYQKLAANVFSELDPRKPVYIIPDKRLLRLPFGSLIAPNQKMLIEDFLIAYAESANTFLDATENAQKKMNMKSERLLVVGNPSLSAHSLARLEDLLPAEEAAVKSSMFYQSPAVLIKQKATKKNVLSELSRANVAHFAMHYLTDNWSPLLSHFMLAANGEEDNPLYMSELYNSPLSSLRLAVLSACQTRSEELYEGEGAIGASRAFEALGVPVVIATLWPVDASASSDLMISFHRMRKMSGLNSAAALRSAQLELMTNNSKYRHPFYWAGFVSVGGHTKF